MTEPDYKTLYHEARIAELEAQLSEAMAINSELTHLLRKFEHRKEETARLLADRSIRDPIRDLFKTLQRWAGYPETYDSGPAMKAAMQADHSDEDWETFAVRLQHVADAMEDDWQNYIATVDRVFAEDQEIIARAKAKAEKEKP